MELPGASVTRKAFAKLNLCLSIGFPQQAGTTIELDGKSKDVSGYHRIASWMACVDLCDDVTVTRKREGEKSVVRVEWAEDAPRPSPIDWAIEKDLAFRAHAALEARVGRTLPVEIVVSKRIPVGGGLGGGSSDAAAVLSALDELFGLGLSTRALREVGMGLGSDVGFFVDGPEEEEIAEEAEGAEERGEEEEGEVGEDEDAEEVGQDDAPESGDDPDDDQDEEESDDEDFDGSDDEYEVGAAPRPALVSSFGEAVERVDLVEGEVVLVVPPFGCETRAVYRAFDEQLAERVAAKKAEILAHKGQAASDRYEAQDAREELVLRRIEKALRAGTLDGDSLFNDLFRPAVAVEPRLGKLMTALSKATRTQAHVTGSGSCVFLVPEEGKAEKLLAKVRKTLEGLGAEADSGTVAMLVRLV